jgi:secretion/DNA translocation related CpaE-like protein
MPLRTAPAPQALPARPHPLLVTRDPDLLDELLRLAEAAGVEVEVAHDMHAARPSFAAAPLVLVDAACGASCLRARLPRRPGLVLVAADPAVEPPWDVAESLGAEHIAVLPAAAPWLVDRFVRAVGTRNDPARVVAVLGGRGGAGASVFAAGLAVTAARHGLRALLVDADPLGGGVDLVLGWEALDGLRWPALAAAEPASLASPASPASLVDVLPASGELAVLSWDRGDVLGVPVDAMAAALDAGRAGRELVVIDLPRRLDDAAALALAAADVALLVVPAELRACVAAARVATAAAGHTTSLRVVVRGPAPGRLKPREIARALGLPLAGSLRAEPELARALERGEPPAGTGKGPLAALCQRLISELELTGGPVAA